MSEADYEGKSLDYDKGFKGYYRSETIGLFIGPTKTEL